MLQNFGGMGAQEQLAAGRARSSISLAENGADIIAVDICGPTDSNPYPLASSEDLGETVALVEKTGQRALAVEADVRSREQLRAAVDAGVTKLGGLHIVVANAGILPMAMGDPRGMDFVDAVDVDFVGVVSTVGAALPVLGAVVDRRDAFDGRADAGSNNTATMDLAVRAMAGRSAHWLGTPNRWRCSWRRK